MQKTLTKDQVYFQIQQLSGAHETECDCPDCQKMCARSVCLGTPQDILEIVKADYAHCLAPSFWAVGAMAGVMEGGIDMVQPIQRDGGCVFFAQGKCFLHDKGLKPSEGKLAHHSQGKLTKKEEIEKAPIVLIAKEWQKEENAEIINQIIQKL